MKTLIATYNGMLENGKIRPDAAQAGAVALLNNLCLALDRYPYRPVKWYRHMTMKRRAAPRGAYLYGGVGRGKSMVMDMFFAAAPVQKKRRVHFHAFMLEVHDYLHALREKRKKSAAVAARIENDLLSCADRIASESLLLCFDEFQVKDVADAMILGRLFTALFDRGVVVVMTSNIAPDDLYANGLQRDRFLPFIQLLTTRTQVYAFENTIDYRLNRLIGRKVYFWPHDADAADTMDRMFATVTGGAAPAPARLSVKGRVIDVPKAAKEAACFTFDVLCGQPRSAVDYLALAAVYRAFFLSDVPQMNDRMRNEALRFVTLIDTLYDNRARLVMSAAVAPEHLYIGDDHREIFTRTVSRIIEMQSRGYGEAEEQAA